jgi:hypothetical protein
LHSDTYQDRQPFCCPSPREPILGQTLRLFLRRLGTILYMPLHAVPEFLLSKGCLNMPSGKLKLLKTRLKIGSTPTTHPKLSSSYDPARAGYGVCESNHCLRSRPHQGQNVIAYRPSGCPDPSGQFAKKKMAKRLDRMYVIPIPRLPAPRTRDSNSEQHHFRVTNPPRLERASQLLPSLPTPISKRV